MAVGISRDLVWTSSGFQEAPINPFLEPALYWIVFGGTVCSGTVALAFIVERVLKRAEAVVSLLRDSTFISLLYFLDMRID